MDVIGLCSDHAGFELKQFVIKWLEGHGMQYKDYGTYSEVSCDYPDYAHLLAESMEKGECSMGVAICGSGNGIAMTLNKHANIRAAIAWSEELSILARLHNDANVLVMPGRFISQEQANVILDAFFSTDFEGGRHLRRIEKIPCQNNK